MQSVIIAVVCVKAIRYTRLQTYENCVNRILIACSKIETKSKRPCLELIRGHRLQIILHQQLFDEVTSNIVGGISRGIDRYSFSILVIDRDQFKPISVDRCIGSGLIGLPTERDRLRSSGSFFRDAAGPEPINVFI